MRTLKRASNLFEALESGTLDPATSVDDQATDLSCKTTSYNYIIAVMANNSMHS